jgi:hypothetical protein
MRYFVTFACYGAHLHGHEAGSVDRGHNVPGTRLAKANSERVAVMRQQMDQLPYCLDNDRRATVLDALREVCVHRRWNRRWSLLAAHVLTNHVHVVVEAEVRPETIMKHAMVMERRPCSGRYPVRRFATRRPNGSLPARPVVTYRSFTVAAR